MAAPPPSCHRHAAHPRPGLLVRGARARSARRRPAAPPLLAPARARAAGPLDDLVRDPIHVLVVDGTNVLSRAAADARRWRAAAAPPALPRAFEVWLDFLQSLAPPPALLMAVFDEARAPGARTRTREQISGEYLARRGRRAARRAAAGPRRGRRPGGLAPYVAAVEARAGLALEASGGAEADDVVGAVCAALREGAAAGGGGGGPRVALASGDTDMQAHLGGDVLWLQLLAAPTEAAPLGAVAVDEAAYLAAHGFPAAAHAEYVALVGKPDAGVGGTGVGAGTARRLLRAFGGLDGAAAAAAAGRLAGWPPAARQLFEPGAPAAERLRRNRALLSAPAGAELLPPDFRRQLVDAAAAAVAAPAGKAAVLDGWAHPLAAWRWETAAPHACALAAALGAGARARAATPGGLPVDVLHEGTAYFVCCPGDFADARAAAAALPRPAGGGEALRAGAGGAALNAALRRHLGAVRRAGLATACVPSWWLPRDGAL